MEKPQINILLIRIYRRNRINRIIDTSLERNQNKKTLLHDINGCYPYRAEVFLFKNT